MFKNEADFEKTVGRLNIDAEPDPKHRADLHREILLTFNKEERQTAIGIILFQTLWRTAVRSPIRGFAAGTAIVAAVTLSIIILLDRSAPSAYAIEQTIEAFKSIRYVHAVQRDEAGQIKDERWIEIGPDGMQARYRQDTPPNLLVVDNRETIFVHRRNKNTVMLSGPESKYTFQWIGSLGEVFRELAREGSVTIEENINYMGRKAHRVRWLLVNQDCYIDPETKLPFTLLGYDVSYGEPPEGIFDIPGIPDGVKLVDLRPGALETSVPKWIEQGEIVREQFRLARHALADGQFAEAVELLSKLVENNPGLGWPRFWLGKARFALGQYDTAIYDFSMVIDKKARTKFVPHYCHLARGLAYAAKGMEEMARRDFDIALPVMIGALRNIEGAFIFDYADDPLMRDGPIDKWPTAQQSLNMMIVRLRTATGQNFDYHPDATSAEQERAIARWEQWYENSGQIIFSADPNAYHIPLVSAGKDK